MRDFYAYVKLLQFRYSNIIQRFTVETSPPVKYSEIAIHRFRKNSDISRQPIFDIKVLWKKLRDSEKNQRFVVRSFLCKNDVGIFQRFGINS